MSELYQLSRAIEMVPSQTRAISELHRTTSHHTEALKSRKRHMYGVDVACWENDGPAGGLLPVLL
jgi:hypothetical protein